MKNRLPALLQSLFEPIQITSNHCCCCMPGGRRLQQPVKKIILFILSFHLLFTVQAQTAHSRKKEDFDVHQFQVRNICIPAPTAKIILVNIGSITVMDARADTGRAGLVQKKVVGQVLTVLNDGVKNRSEQRVNKTPTFLQLAGGVQNQATKFVRASLAFTGNDSLPGILMVIKKLWVSDELNLQDAVHLNENVSRQFNKDYWTSGIDIDIEFYLKDEAGYYPLYRYDSVISETMTVSEYGPAFVAQALLLSLKKMSRADKDIAAVKKRHSFSLEEINQHNQSNFNLPVLKDEVAWPGVYMTFAEFKNNNPAHISFDLQKDKRTDIIYLKQAGGGEYVARDVWGYCDGKNRYIKAGDNFFLLQRLGNAFYIFGAKNIKWEGGQGYPSNTSYNGQETGYALPVYYKSSKWELQLKPFQLDWSTGKLY